MDRLARVPSFGTRRQKLSPVAFLLGLAVAISCRSAPELPTFSEEPGFDRPGADYKVFEIDSSYPSFELCRDSCGADKNCKAFTYVRPDIRGPRAVCVLKGKETEPVADDCCTSGVRGGKPRYLPVAGLQLDWLGVIGDHVGGGPSRAEPDDRTDHHFRARFDLDAAAELRSVELEAVDGAGSPYEMFSHSTSNSERDFLAVEIDGRRLNSDYADDLGQVPPDTILDLYVNDTDPARFGQGSLVRLRVELSDGSRLTTIQPMHPPPWRLMGDWDILCSNNSPEAFEPAHSGGRFLLDLSEEGTVTGSFGHYVVNGSTEEGETVRGSGTWGDSTLTFTGTLERTQEGLLAGRGELEVSGGDCFGGSWYGPH